MKKIISSFLILGLCMVFATRTAPQAQAAPVFKSGEQVKITSDEVVDGTLFISGKTLTIDGEVLGDVFCAGESVKILADVEGDVFCAAQHLEISGTVGGNIRSVAQFMVINGSVLRNVTVAGQGITVQDTAVIDGEVYSASSNLSLNGFIGRGFSGTAETASVNATVDGKFSLDTDNLTVGEMASLPADSTYYSASEANVHSSNQQVNSLRRKEPEMNAQKQKENKKNREPKTYLLRYMTSVIGILIIGGVLLLAVPSLVVRASGEITSRFVLSLAIGVAALFLIPILCILIAITILGIPLAFVGMMIWGVLLLLSTALSAFALGSIVRSRVMQSVDQAWGSLVIGALLLSLLFFIPAAGWIVRFLAMSSGVGALIQAFMHRKQAHGSV